MGRAPGKLSAPRKVGPRWDPPEGGRRCVPACLHVMYRCRWAVKGNLFLMFKSGFIGDAVSFPLGHENLYAFLFAFHA